MQKALRCDHLRAFCCIGSAVPTEDVRRWAVNEYFWMLDDEPSDRPVRARKPQVDSYPASEPMRGARRYRRAPSTDEKRVKRRMNRTSAHAYGEVDWNEIWPKVEGQPIHRGFGINLPDDLHREIHDDSRPVHERAAKLLDHISGTRARDKGDHRYGLGMHWSLNDRIAEDFAERSAEHYADGNKNGHAAHDFSWGRTTGDIDMEKVSEHVHEHHGVHPDLQPESSADLQRLHHELHVGPPPMEGQQALFPEPPRKPGVNKHLDLSEFQEDEPHAKPGTAVMIHSIPERDHIDEDPSSNPNKGGDVYHPFGHGEEEIPIRSGASLPIHRISWKPVHHWMDEVDPEPDWTHHDFGGSEHREASKTATVLNTQIERLNPGDQVRTPTGQVAEVKKVRPHETDSTMIYLDTDMGTSVVKRGTDFQVIPRNSQQQELPDVGNVMGGNFPDLPGAGRTPGGPGAGHMPGGNPASSHMACPNCGNTGTLSLHGNQFVCSVCGFQIAAGGSPGGLTFTNWPSGVSGPRKKPGEVPKAHVWASRYSTVRDEGNVIARRARQVLDKEDM